MADEIPWKGMSSAIPFKLTPETSVLILDGARRDARLLDYLATDLWSAARPVDQYGRPING